jgi:hypothetical protein
LADERGKYDFSLIRLTVVVVYKSKGRTIRKVMGRVGKKQKKNPCKQKRFEKKYMHQTCLKCEKTYF